MEPTLVAVSSVRPFGTHPRRSDAWYDQQIAAGQTPAQIDAYLAGYDTEDRYDYNGDGDFNQPDGYIDHFESIHAGDGEETGGGAQGEDAIWSHRWFAFYNLIGSAGPAFNLLGGIRVGQSNYWIGDYQMQPENGGVGVFSHEFGHDLGLPDEYDTAGNTCGSACENSTAWWTLMSQGSYGTANNTDLGTKPVSMNSWDKLQLGWLDYDLANSTTNSNHTLGPAEYNTANPQAVVVTLPDKQVTTAIGAPFAGSKFYYSNFGDNLDTSMTESVTLPAGASLAAKVRYNIEEDWDYAYLRVSTNGGATWANIATNLSTSSDPNGQNFGAGITGVSTGSAWVDVTADLSAYAGQTVLLGFRYWTDGAQQGPPGGAYTPDSRWMRSASLVAQPMALKPLLAGRSARRRAASMSPGGRRRGTSTRTSPSIASIAATTMACALAPTTSASWITRTSRTTSSTSPMRMVCSSGIGTAPRVTTTRATTLDRV